MRKIVINSCHGGFRLSEKVIERIAELRGVDANSLYPHFIARDNPDLVRVVEELGEAANTRYSQRR